MNKKILLAALMASTFTIATPSNAASHFMKGMIDNYDLNGDGKVSSEEYAQVRISRFSTTDRDGSGSISPAEYLSEFEVRLESMLKKSELRKTTNAFDTYQDIDFNLDHVITREEYVRATQESFEKHDKNSDGLITKDDKGASRRFGGVMKKYDTNGDNEVTFAEYSKVKNTAFLTADTSKNNLLSKIEYVLAAENDATSATKTARDGQIKQTDVRFKAVDENKDNVMTWAEYEASGLRMFDHLDTNKDGTLSDDDPAPKRQETASNQSNDKSDKKVASNDGAS